MQIGFHRQQATLCCDEVDLGVPAEAVGTPLYVYSAGVVRARVAEFRDAFAGYPHAIHYALKANSNLALVRLVCGLGCGVDANSLGEVDLALRAGCAPADIVFSGVGKTSDELARAVELGLKSINAESPGELARLDALARARGVRARAALRVNPDVDAQSHPHISTGRQSDKFGVPLADAAEICRNAARWPGLALIGLHVHIGSQMLQLEPIARAARSVAGLVRELRAAGVGLEYLDLGGGLGVSYDDAPAPSMAEYALTLRAAVSDTGLPIVLEPGRVLVAAAGALVACVVDVKRGGDGRTIVVLDAGMTEFMRPALYGAYHRVEPVTLRPGPSVVCDFVGPVCESSDVIASGRPQPAPQAGDRVAILDAGAYGFVMASNYNRRPLPAEVLVDGAGWRTVRRRQTLDDLVALETV